MKSAVEGGLSFMQTGDASLEVKLAGAWRLRGGLPSASLLQRELESGAASQKRRLRYQGTKILGQQRSGFFCGRLRAVPQRGIQMDTAGLPSGLHRLLNLAEAVPEKKGARKESVATPFLERVGNTAIGAGSSLAEMLAFLGDMTLTFFRLLRMNVRFRAVDLVSLYPAGRRRGAADRQLDQFFGRRDSRLRRRRAIETIRRADLRCRSGRHCHGPRDGRDDDRNHHGGPHRRGLRRTAGHDESDPGDRRLYHHGLFSIGILGAAARARAGVDDAAALSLFRHRRRSRWRRDRGRHARSIVDDLFERDHERYQPDGCIWRRVQSFRLRGVDRPLWVPTRNPMRQQFFRGGRCGNFGCGHRDRRHCRCLRRVRGSFLRAGDLTWAKRMEQIIGRISR